MKLHWVLPGICNRGRCGALSRIISAAAVKSCKTSTTQRLSHWISNALFKHYKYILKKKAKKKIYIQIDIHTKHTLIYKYYMLWSNCIF